jgi:hypothetical protein
LIELPVLDAIVPITILKKSRKIIIAEDAEWQILRGYSILISSKYSHEK